MPRQALKPLYNQSAEEVNINISHKPTKKYAKSLSRPKPNNIPNYFPIPISLFSFFFFLSFINFFYAKNIFKITKNPFFKKLGFTPCKAEQPLQGMELQKKEAQKD